MLKNNQDKIIGLLGNIDSSLSPKIHNYLANMMGLKYQYYLFNIEHNQLKDAVKSIKTLKIRGVNVTIPYKDKVIKYLDQLDPKAKEIKAVNTILNENGRLKGFNTDLYGFDEMCFRKGCNFSNKNVLIIGAGGASKAVIYFLKDQNLNNLTILNRTVKNAKELKKRYDNDFNSLDILKLDQQLDNIKDKKIDIIINTTPLGMEGKYQEISPLLKDYINQEQTIIDLIYQPRVTKLLSFGKEKGAKIISGIEMLVYQAVKSFEIWTKTRVEVDFVKDLINNL